MHLLLVYSTFVLAGGGGVSVANAGFMIHDGVGSYM